MIIAPEPVAGYDIIGDVHGCAQALKDLLVKMDYENKGGVWQHGERKAIFVGDILDRGPEVRAAMMIVRRMVDAGAAHMTLGNHEYNAIVYSTELPIIRQQKLVRYYRRLGAHLRQSLVDFQSHLPEWQSLVHWLRQQPLSLEFENFRVVHACWDNQKIDYLRDHWCSLPLRHDDFVQRSLDPSEEPHRVVETLLKGVDLALPDGQMMMGSDGVRRSRFRTNFWSQAPETYGDVLFQPDKLPQALMQTPLSSRDRQRLLTYEPHQKPLFVGHYWCRGMPKVICQNIACLDYSAVKNGRLVAYRIGNEGKLDNANFVWVNSEL